MISAQSFQFSLNLAQKGCLFLEKKHIKLFHVTLSAEMDGAYSKKKMYECFGRRRKRWELVCNLLLGSNYVSRSC